MLLHEDDNLKICDFAGSSIDGSPPTVDSDTRNQTPNHANKDEAADIFALGSCVYEMVTTYRPYHDKPEREIEQLYTKSFFPSLSGRCRNVVALSHFVRACWNLRIHTADEAFRMLEKRGRKNNKKSGLIYGRGLRIFRREVEELEMVKEAEENEEGDG